MKVIGVTIENYGAFHGVHTFQYGDRGLTLVLGENLDEPRMNSNGAAKSTLFECLDWCWYGKVPREDHADSIINDQATTCRVTSHLEDDDGTPAIIERSRPNALKFWIDGKELTALDTKETQKLIDQYLGMDRDVFRATVFFAQNDLHHFADVGDAKRVEILTKIIPELATVDDYLERAKLRQQRQTESLEKVRREVATVEGKLEGLEGLKFGDQIAQWEAQRQADRTATTGRIAELEKYVQDHQGEVEQLGSLEEEAARLMTVQKPVKPQHAETALQQAEEQVTRLHAARSVAQAEVATIQQTIQKLAQSKTGICSQCGQEITQEHLAKEGIVQQLRLNEASRKAEQALQAWVEAQGPVAALKAQKAQVEEEWLQAEQLRTASLNELNRKVMALQQLQNYLEGAQVELRACDHKLQGIDAAVNPFVVEAQKVEKQKEDLHWELEGARDAVEKAQEALEYTNYWVRAFGPKGIKNYILDSKLQEMTDAANHWVKVLTAGTFWIRFETQKKGRSTKRLTNELNIRVFRYNPDGRISERNYKSWSGGEKKRVSLAIDFGLSRLVARRAKKRYDLLILDELFKHVDSAGGEAIAEMLEELKREKSSIFVIEHNPEMQARFENRVLVRRKDSRSTIVELDNVVSGERQTPSRPAEAQPKRKAVRHRVSSRTPMLGKQTD